MKKHPARLTRYVASKKDVMLLKGHRFFSPDQKLSQTVWPGHSLGFGRKNPRFFPPHKKTSALPETHLQIHGWKMSFTLGKGGRPTFS